MLVLSRFMNVRNSRRSWKIPTEQSKSIKRRKTDHTMPKRKRHKMIYKTLYRKEKIEQNEPH